MCCQGGAEIHNTNVHKQPKQSQRIRHSKRHPKCKQKTKRKLGNVSDPHLVTPDRNMKSQMIDRLDMYVMINMISEISASHVRAGLRPRDWRSFLFGLESHLKHPHVDGVFDKRTE